MIPLNILEHQNAVKTLYSKCVGQICRKHGITRMELDILLFLANNPCFDTATDIVEIRCLSKSQVSASVKLLEERGFIRKNYEKENRKTAHLVICGAAAEVTADGKRAQEKFLSIMMEGIPQEEVDGMKRCMEHILENIRHYLREDKKEESMGEK